MKLAVREFNKLISKRERLENEMKQKQRERDLKVDAVNNKYEAEIGDILRQLDEIKIIIDDTRILINKTRS